MDLVGDLDRFLEEAGEDILLRRVIAGIPVDVTVRASVRNANKPDEMMSGTKQDDIRAVISMTQIRQQGWPGAGDPGVAPFITDPALPRRGDVLVVKGAKYRVEVAEAIAVRNNVVRVVMTAKGNASGA